MLTCQHVKYPIMFERIFHANLPLLARLVQTPYFSVNDLKEAVNHLFTPDLRTRHKLVHFSLLYIFKGWNIEHSVFGLRLQSFVNVPSNPLLRLLTRISLLTLLKLDKTSSISNINTAAGTVGADARASARASARVIRICCHAVISITCLDIKPSIRVPWSSSGSADLLEPLDCLFTPPSSGTALPIRRIPCTLVLTLHFHWQRLCHTEKRYHAALCSTSWVLSMINPASPCRMVLGVAERELGYTFAQSLGEDGVERALVVCGYEKIDDIRGVGPTWVWELFDGQVIEGILTCKDFGLNRHSFKQSCGWKKTRFKVCFIRDLIPVMRVVAEIAKDYKERIKLACESLETFKDEGK